MPAPPAKEEISAPFPNPSNAVARAGFGKLHDYMLGLLGSTGNAAEARAALGAFNKAGDEMEGLMTFAAGDDIASAATVDLTAATGNTVHITGTTAITAWTLTAGQRMNVIFDGALELTYNATTNRVSGGVSVTTEANGVAEISYDGTTVYVDYVPATIVSQVTAEAGIDGQPRKFSVQRIAQMITALAGSSIKALHVRDEKPSGTDAGTFTSGAWRTRVLNTVVTNEISGASLASNQITLPAGTYIVRASAPAAVVDRHRAKLVNITDTSDIVLGTSENTSSADTVGTRSLISGKFTISASKVIELQHRCLTSRGSNGLGVMTGFGDVEVYAEVLIIKVA